MPNQMIALQARNPQIADPSRQTAQFANMMNMARQAEAAQLQGQRIRQEMDYARASEDRAQQTQQASMREKDQSFMVNDMKRLRNIGVAVLGSRSEEGYQSWVDMVEAADPQLGATIRQTAPTFNPDIMNYLITEADKYIEKNIPQRTSKSEFDENGNLIIIDQGGFDPAKIRAGVITDQPDMARPQSGATATPTATPTAAAGAPMRATRGSNTTPQDLINQGMDPRNIPSGMPTSRPVSFSQNDMGGAGAARMTPEMAQQVVDTAVKTGMMAQADFDQLMAMAPEQNKQPFMDMIKSNNITLQPGGMGRQQPMLTNPVETPQARFADLGGQPMMPTTEAQYQVGQQVRGKNPSISPAPAEIPLARRGAEARAERVTPGETAANAQATQGVELDMKPKIAAATKTAERVAELKVSAPKAKNATLSIIADIDDRIATIDKLLRNPNRRLINGPIEGNLPRLLQTGPRADAQADFDKIKNTATLTSLIDMRKSTETGASPVGANPTDRDAKIVEQAASSLIQTGELAKMDAELMAMRRKLYRTRTSAAKGYEAEYGDVIASSPNFKLNVPAIADRYISTKDLPKRRTSVRKTLRFNPATGDFE